MEQAIELAHLQRRQKEEMSSHLRWLTQRGKANASGVNRGFREGEISREGEFPREGEISREGEIPREGKIPRGVKNSNHFRPSGGWICVVGGFQPR